MTKSICYFGSFKKDYPRNLLTQKAFMKLGWKIVEVHNDGGGFGHYTELIQGFLKNGRKCDLIFVGVLGHYDVPLAWIMAKIFRKKIIFDAFYPLLDAYVNDRKNVKKFSFTAFRMYLYDLLSINLADYVILDTKENIEYYVKKYPVKKHKFDELLVSVDPGFFKFNSKRTKKKFYKLGFYGSFLSLHGVSLIINAFRLLSDKKYQLFLLGSGPGLTEMKQLVINLKLENRVTFLPNLPYHKLKDFYNTIDLFLAGPFGTTDKAERILPAKAVEAMAIGIPTVIRESKTTKRLLKNYKGNVFWLEKNTSVNLSNLIKNLSSKKTQPTPTTFLNSPFSFDNFTKKLSKIIQKNL